MANTLIKADGVLFYPVKSGSRYNNNPMEIWIKFSKHLREDEKVFIDRVSSKDLDSLTADELIKLSEIKKQILVSKLLPKYKEHACTEEEHDLVYSFMERSLKVFVNERMSNEERINAHTFVASLTKEILKDFIKEQEDKYEDLTVYEAYVLFTANEYLANIEDKELRDRILAQTHQNNIQLRKNLVRDYSILC